MHKLNIIFFAAVLGNFTFANERKIDDCTLILDDLERLQCFDSFFKTEKNMILIDQDDVVVFEEKEEVSDKKDKVVVKASRSVINENLILTGLRLSGRDLVFELNDKSTWKSIETVRKKDIPTPGDKVELEPGIFGSMFLKIKGKKNKIRIKKLRK